MPTEDGKLSMEEMLTEAAGGEIETNPEEQETNPEEQETNPEEQETNPEEQETNPEEQETNPEEGEGEGEGEGEDGDNDDSQTDAKKNENPVKQLREQYKTEKSQRQRITDLTNKYVQGNYEFTFKDYMNEEGTGVDYDALEEAMKAADTKAKAEEKGITPEVQAELDRIEQEKIQLQKERLQINMDKALTELQIQRNIDNKNINQFFKDAMEQSKNPYRWLAQGGSLGDLYNIVYADKITQERIDQAVADARKEWEAANTPGGRPPANNPAGRQQGQGAESNKNEGPTLDELRRQAAAKLNK